jgi:hypothetical protein
VSSSSETPAGRLATERLIAAALDCDRYVNGTHFIPSDAPDLAPMLARCLEDRDPVALISPDGRELLATPVLGRLGGLVAAAMQRLRRGRTSAAGATGPVTIPPLYRVELRESPVGLT